MFRKLHHLFIRSDDPLMRHFSGQGSRKLLRRPWVNTAISICFFLLSYIVVYLSTRSLNLPEMDMANGILAFHFISLIIMGTVFTYLCIFKPSLYLQRMGDAFLLQDLKLTQLSDQEVFRGLYFGCYRQSMSYFWVYQITLTCSMVIHYLVYCIRIPYFLDFDLAVYASILHLGLLLPLGYTFAYQGLAWRYAFKWKQPWGSGPLLAFLLVIPGPICLAAVFFLSNYFGGTWLSDKFEEEPWYIFSIGWYLILLLDIKYSHGWKRFWHHVRAAWRGSRVKGRTARAKLHRITNAVLIVSPCVFFIAIAEIAMADSMQDLHIIVMALIAISSLAWCGFAMRLQGKFLRDFRKVHPLYWFSSMRIGVIMGLTLIYSIVHIYCTVAYESYYSGDAALLMFTTSPLLGLKLIVIGKLIDSLPRDWPRLAVHKLGMSA